MELEPETREHRTHALLSLLDRRFRVAHHHEIVGVADQCAEMRTPVLPHSVEDMQIDVGKQRGDHAALRCARDRRAPPAFLHHTRREPEPQQLQHPAIRDSSLNQRQQLGVRDAAEVVADVRIQHMVATACAMHAQRF